MHEHPAEALASPPHPGTALLLSCGEADNPGKADRDPPRIGLVSAAWVGVPCLPHPARMCAVVVAVASRIAPPVTGPAP
jgi:hypothetical protein